MNRPQAEVSVIILAKNEDAHISACLDAVLGQETNRSFDVLVIDSGSADGTVAEVLRRPGVRLLGIPPEEFGHGRTRNLGARQAIGQYLVFLNADALPADGHWLDALIDGFAAAPHVAGVFSRQLPRPGCHWYMQRDLERSLPGLRIVRTRSSARDFMLFSTVSAAISRALLEQMPFPDEIDIAEDQAWAHLALASGWAIVYEPASAVIHSHNYSARALFRTKSRVSAAIRPLGGLRGTAGALAGVVLGIPLRLGGDLLYISKQKAPLRRKVNEIGIAISARTASFCGRLAGTLARKKRG